MESQEDIVDLTINDDNVCFFLTEPPNEMATAKKNHEDVSVCESEDGESVYGLEDGEITAKQNQEDDTLSVYGVYGSEDGKITAKQNQEDDSLSVYGSEDGEITAKQNQQDDTLSCYRSEDGEIATKEEEKEEESKK